MLEILILFQKLFIFLFKLSLCYYWWNAVWWNVQFLYIHFLIRNLITMWVLRSWWWKLSLNEFLLRLKINWLLNWWCVVKVQIIFRVTWRQLLMGKIWPICVTSFLVQLFLMLNGLYFHVPLLLLLTISGTLTVWIKISFTSIRNDWRIATILWLIWHNLLLFLIFIILEKSLQFSRKIYFDFLLIIFIWDCFIFCRSFNWNYLLLEWIFYRIIALFLVLLLFFIWILCILRDTYHFISILSFNPFFLSYFSNLLLILCSRSSCIDNIIRATTGNKTAFILHEFLKQFRVFYRIQIHLTVILVPWLLRHSLKFDLTFYKLL